MNLNVPGFSDGLIFTMGNNDKKCTVRVLLKPDVSTIPARGQPSMNPAITVSEDAFSVAETFIYVASALYGQMNTGKESQNSRGLSILYPKAIRKTPFKLLFTCIGADVSL